MNWNQKSLNILGLNSTEICILNTIDTQKNVKQITAESGVSRTGVNYCLKNLISKGLAFPIRSKRRISYISITPEDLTNIFQNLTNEINCNHAKIKGAKIITSLRDEFTIHIGLDEIIPAYTRIASINKNERVRGIQHHRSYNELMEKITPKQLSQFNKSIIKNHIIMDGILNQSAYKAYREEITKDPKKFKEAVDSLSGRMADYTSFPDNFFNFDSEIWIFKNTTMIINWHEEVAIEITNQNMTGFLKDMFEFVKAGGKKINHNEEMKKLGK